MVSFFGSFFSSKKEHSIPPVMSCYLTAGYNLLPPLVQGLVLEPVLSILQYALY
jgi:hypothetical protein